MALILGAKASSLCVRWAPFVSPGECACGCDNELWQPMEGGIVDYADEKCNHHSHQF